MKSKELHNLSEEELKKQLEELKKELMKENAQVAIGTNPSNPGNIKKIKKTIAQIKTKLNSRTNSKNKKVKTKK